MFTYSFISQDILCSADMDLVPLTVKEVDVATVMTPPDAQIVLHASSVAYRPLPAWLFGV